MTCPVCKGTDTAYLRCQYPGCPDGRPTGVPLDRRVTRRTTLSDFFVRDMMFGFALATAVVVLFALVGCVAGPPVTFEPACATCVGPYDVMLKSHREALGL